MESERLSRHKLSYGSKVVNFEDKSLVSRVLGDIWRGLALGLGIELLDNNISYCTNAQRCKLHIAIARVINTTAACMVGHLRQICYYSTTATYNGYNLQV